MLAGRRLGLRRRMPRVIDLREPRSRGHARHDLSSDRRAMTRVLLVVVPPGADAHDTGPRHPERIGASTAALAGVADAHLDDARRDERRSRRHPRRARARARRALRRRARRVRPRRWRTARCRHGRRARRRSPPRSGRPGCGLARGRRAARRRGRRRVRRRPPTRPPRDRERAARASACSTTSPIAAAALVARGERVLIVDWDVHHGNGTQDIFWDDPTVLFVSTHQYPAYPGTGRADETGGARAPGSRSTSRCRPARPATSRSPRSTRSWRPAVERFAPTWVLVSAGFDAHRADPLADLAWSAGDYARARDAASLEFAPDAGPHGRVPRGRLRPRRAAGVGRRDRGGARRRRRAVRRRRGPTSGGPGRDVGRRAPRALAAEHVRERSSIRTTSSSVVGEKSRYHWPIAANGVGVATHTTASATCRELAHRVARRDRHREHHARRARRRARRRSRRRAVLPVARPSSTRITVPTRRARRAAGRRAADRARRASSTLLAVPRPPRAAASAIRQRVEHLVVEHAHAAFADGAHRQLGLPGSTELAHDDHVERSVERPCHHGRDRDAAAGERDDDRVAGRRAPGARPARAARACAGRVAGRRTGPRSSGSCVTGTPLADGRPDHHDCPRDASVLGSVLLVSLVLHRCRWRPRPCP